MSDNKEKLLTTEELKNFSKGELIQKVLSLQGMNATLKSIIAKSQPRKAVNKIKKPFDFTKCEYRHILLRFLYLGWDYQGFVVVEDTTNTIENHLINALIKTCLIEDRTKANYHKCGRTDKGVSSFGQVISLTVRSKFSKDNQNDLNDELDYCKLLNHVLPDDIQCIAWKPISEEFSARFNCIGRTYKYFFPKCNLNIEEMRRACNYLIGSHDFRNFCKVDLSKKANDFLRFIIDATIEPIQSKSDEDWYSMYVFTIKGKAFLWHQIRCIMGVLFLVGQEKEKPEIIEELLNVERNPRKPVYTMANEIPLNLYASLYDIDDDWVYNETTLQKVFEKLQKHFVFSNIKAVMLKSIINDLNVEHNSENGSYCLIENMTKAYVPLMKRGTCTSLEDKLERYKKRKQCDMSNDSK